MLFESVMSGSSREEKIDYLIKKEDYSEAFNAIVDTYKERLYIHIRKIVIIHDNTDDVLQNTFIKIWKHLKDFKGDSKIFTWIYRIATNEAITYLNKLKKEKTIGLDGVEEYFGNLLDHDEYFDGDQAQLLLQKAILTLPEKQRLVFNMKYFDEMKYSDMSEILDVTEGGLKASYHIAVKKIEEFLKNN
jgi:RNA polymerase sigma-70 factor (ECF subfamily)